MYGLYQGEEQGSILRRFGGQTNVVRKHFQPSHKIQSLGCLPPSRKGGGFKKREPWDVDERPQSLLLRVAIAESKLAENI